MKTTLKIILTFVVFANIALLSGCNTVQGFGKDMQQGGHALETAADRD